MTLLVLFLAAIFTVFVVYRTIAPFLEPREKQWHAELLGEELQVIEQLVTQRTSLLRALRDIELDWKTDKISDEDYHHYKKSYERRAVSVMRQLENIHGGRSLDEAIDAEIQQRLEIELSGVADAVSDSHEALDTSTEPMTCEQCNNPITVDDRFCSQCGAPTEPSFEATKVEPKDADVITHTRGDARTLSHRRQHPEAAR